MTSLKKMDFLIWGSRPLNRKEKRRQLKHLIRENDKYILYHFYKVLEEIDAIKINYVSYSSTHPVDVTEELKRLPNVEYESCCAIATMLIRENYFIYGALEQRVANGDVKRVLMRMIELL